MASNYSEEKGGFMLVKYQDEDETNNHGRTKMNIIQAQAKADRKVAIVYYLSRNGQLEHPHFIEVSLSSSSQGLHLRDVINKLNTLRGEGMATMYSWASKRRYKNAFIWQDLLDDDLIHPCQDQDYILKGSLLLDRSPSFRSNDSISSSWSSRLSSEIKNSSSESEDFAEKKVYNATTVGGLRVKGFDASTQTEDNQKVNFEAKGAKPDMFNSTKLNSKQVSTPIANPVEVHSSARSNVRYQKFGKKNPGARSNESVALMKLIGCGCGSKRFKDFDAIGDSYS